MAGELDAPLSRVKARRERTRSGGFHLPLARILFAVIGLAVIGIGARLLLVDDPEGGRPVAEVEITAAADPNPLATAVGGEDPAHGNDHATADGNAVPVIVPGQPQGPTIIVLDDLPGGDAGAQDAPVETAAVSPELVEETQFGPIPRMGGNGETPFKAYAGPTPPELAGKIPIAVVVMGLGLNEAGTMGVIESMPAPVSLAFAPYGKALERTVATARAEGHEVLLEVPLEPFDYPDNDPGPQTLLTGEPARDNLEKLFWLMARFEGYVGMINHMGARFTASGADFSPFMEELGTRGLGYLDDGSSNRSLAPQLAKANKVPFGRADMVLDTNPAPEPIRAALARLEARATEAGGAIGIVSALPVSVETLAEWSAGLEGRGFALVPVSSLMR